MDNALGRGMGRVHGNCSCAAASRANYPCLQIVLSVTVIKIDALLTRSITMQIVLLAGTPKL
jgi:hypothetical protein